MLRWMLLAALVAVTGCDFAELANGDASDAGDGSRQSDGMLDGGIDVPSDIVADGGVDSGVDVATDRGAADIATDDAPADGTADVPTATDAIDSGSADAGTDATVNDAGNDVGTDVVMDSGVDVSPDTGSVCSMPMTTCGTSCVNTATSSANCGACGNACPSATPICVSSRCVCTTYYVSQLNGDDSRDGCSPATAKLTIGAAIAAARAVVGASPGPQVLVCAGTYAEAPLTLNAAVSIHGGYDCSAWTRSTTFGYPTFDGANTTTVSNASYASVDTMVVTGGAVGPSVVIDGLSIQGATASGVHPLNGANGLHVQTNARPRVIDNVIVGGGGVDARDGIHGINGILVDGAAAPEIAHNNIQGSLGDGAGSHGQATGIYLAANAGAPHIHDNTIVGGDQLNTQANGIYVTSAAEMTQARGAAIENNRITAATSTMGGVGSSQSNAIMVFSNTGSLDIVSNVLDGTGQTRAVGIYLNFTSGSIRILQNRIYGGQKNGYLGGGTDGIWLNNAPGVEITNNMIHGGSKNGANATSSAGIEVDFSAGAIIRHNTIYSGRRASSGMAVAINVLRSTATTISNNILMGTGNAMGPGVEYGLSMSGEGCPMAGGISAFRSNLFLNFGTALSLDNCVGSGGMSFRTIDLVEQDITANSTSSVDVQQNRVLRTSCPTSPAEMGCISFSCGTDPNCIFPAWTDGDTGYAALVAPMNGGWLLVATDPCAIVRSADNDVNQVPTDIFGTTRAPTSSIGAHEFAGSCL